MIRSCFTVFTFALCFLASRDNFVAANDEKLKAQPKSENSKKLDALLKKVFTAYGGLEKLKKHTTWREVRKITLEINRRKWQLTHTTTVQLPDQYRNENTVGFAGGRLQSIAIYDKDKAWQFTTSRGLQKKSKSDGEKWLKIAVERGLRLILALADPKRRRSVAPDTKVGKVAVFVIKVYSANGQPHESWHFDKKTALLVSRSKSTDASTYVLGYSNYAKIDGTPYARSLISRYSKSGRITVESKIEVTLTLPKTIDPKLFEKPTETK